MRWCPTLNPSRKVGPGGARVTDSIDEAIRRLEAIVADTRRENSRLGYFAAMYLGVTRAVRDAIIAGEFDNGDRMARFDLVFANRYLDAYDRFKLGGPTTEAWRISFSGAAKWRPIIVQQLLTGMNAHINLDLGVAAATVAPGAELPGLENDFNTINDVLARLTSRFVADVESVSPWIRLLDRIGGRSEQQVIKFSIDVAREEAWKLAESLSPLPEDQWQPVIAARDEWTADFGAFVLRPGWLLPIGLLAIRLRETNDVDKVIDALSHP